MMGGGLRGGIVGGGFRSATVAGGFRGVSMRGGFVGSRIGSVIAASPSRRCHSRSELASMAARVGLGNQPLGLAAALPVKQACDVGGVN